MEEKILNKGSEEMKNVEVKFVNYTKTIINIPEVKMYWQGSYQQVPLQLGPLQERHVKVAEDNIFAEYTEVNYKLKNGKLEQKLKARAGWKDPLKGKANVVKFINNSNRTAHFREEDIPGTSGIHIPPGMTIRKEVKNEGRFKDCVRVEINSKLERGIAVVNPTMVPTVSINYVYKDAK